MIHPVHGTHLVGNSCSLQAAKTFANDRWEMASHGVLSMSGNQPLDTSTSTGRLILSVIGAVVRVPRLKAEGVRPSEIARKQGICRAERLSRAGRAREGGGPIGSRRVGLQVRRSKT